MWKKIGMDYIGDAHLRRAHLKAEVMGDGDETWLTAALAYTAGDWGGGDGRGGGYCNNDGDSGRGDTERIFENEWNPLYNQWREGRYSLVPVYWETAETYGAGRR